MDIGAEIDDAIDIFDGQDSMAAETSMSDNARRNLTSWVDKYRPRTLDDMVLNAKTKSMLKEMVSKGELENMSLCGSCGKGKTTLAKVLARAVGAETLFIPCGTDGTTDVVRSRIQPFCESASSGRVKCVILDEFDSASGGNAASNGMQKALRSIIESFVDTRFIITCNYPKKIIDPIFSRCPKVDIGFTLRDVCVRLKEIWDAEGVKYDSATAREFASKHAYMMMPDVRGIIRLSQMFSVSGALVLNDEAVDVSEKGSLRELADRIVGAVAKRVDYRAVRQMAVNGSSAYRGDYEALVSAMCDSIVSKGMDCGMVSALSEFAYRMSQVSDPLLQLTAAIITLEEMAK